MFATTKLLEKHGHEVIPFSMNHPLNFNSSYSKYWTSYINFKEALKKKNLGTALNVIMKTVYSFEAKKCIARLLDDEKPDIVHIHNILHHITPSILSEIKKRKIPIIWTLHDYTIICPNTSFLTERGEICEACKQMKFFMALIKRCKKNSLGASFVAMLENYMHRFMRVFRYVDKFISPSEFLKQKFIEFGMGEKIVTLNNFIDTGLFVPNFNNYGYYIYVGRLHHTKGLDTLITAARRIPDIELKVVGDGAMLENLKSQGIGNIDFVGFKSGDELKELVSNAMFVVVPSEWYENFPYSILEAFASGKAVIGSRIGGIPELVKDNVTGLTFECRNSENLRLKIEYLISNPDRIVEMGKNARKFAEDELNAEKHYQRLMRIYQQGISSIL